MIPSMTKQNTAKLVSPIPALKTSFWTGYRAALEDMKTHSLTELEAMASMELAHGVGELKKLNGNMPRVPLHLRD